MTSDPRLMLVRAGAARLIIILALLGPLLAACGGDDAGEPTAASAPTATARATPVHAPTATPSPTVGPTPPPTRAPRDPEATAPVFSSDNDGVPEGIEPCALLDPDDIETTLALAVGAGEPGAGAGTCQWPLGTTADATSVTLELMTRLDAQERVPPEAVPIPRLGDDAWWDGSAVTVVSGDLAFGLILAIDAGEAEARDLTIALAEIVLTRLP